MALRQFQPYLDDNTTIRVELEKRFDADTLSFTLESQQVQLELTLLQKSENDTTVTYLLTSPQILQLEEDYLVYDQDRNRCELAYGKIVRTPEFDQLFTYEGNDLGANYSAESTSFKFWAPISKQVFVVVEGEPHALRKENHGVWATTLSGDLEGKSYHYLHRLNGQWISVHDPYALSSTANSGDSFVINPAKLHTPKRANIQVPLSQAILYEMSVRDFSQQKEAGFQHPGLFAGLTESPTLENYTLGFDYIKELGVTHIQLMPLYDFGSVDELHPQAVYNWGYDPVQYNVPEGSFSSNPNDPYTRILELQTAIQTYHDANISVIMDVVYNHVYNADTYAFEKIVPGYFYRYDEKGERFSGTFCGNDVASDRAMVRRYIKQSLRQWVSLYGFDGFRFDLMGILDTQTMNEAAAELQALYPNIYLYGEGWQMGTGMPTEKLAHQYNASDLPNYSFFNDDYRDTFKKVLLNPQNLLVENRQEKVQNLLAASRNSHFIKPEQSLNYLECHDNATLFDYFQVEDPDFTEHAQKRASSFGLQLVLISQGLTFIHSGQEFFRTKDGIDNSYNIPDSINRLDWTRAVQYKEHVQFIRDLIAFRKAHPALSQTDYKQIQESCEFYWLTDFVLRYQVATGTETIQFIINFSHDDFLYQQEDKEASIRFTYPPVEDPKAEQVLIAGQSICTLTRPNR